MSAVKSVAVDLGAESGRVAVGAFDGTRLAIEEIHRFPNRPVRALGGEYWDVLGLFDAVKQGLARVGATIEGEVATVGCDTWGLDFGFLAADGTLLATPRTYRDPRTTGMMDWVFRSVPPDRVFAVTGIQFMPINSLYQLAAIHRQSPRLLEAARTLLMIPDLFNYWLTGEAVSERTNASTTQFLDARTGEWARTMLGDLGIPTHFLPGLVAPGTALGPLHPSVQREVGLPTVRAVLPACHDTGSAVVGVPAQTTDFAYISSGTWSLVGVELDHPVLDGAAQAANLSNEGGVEGTFRLLKNVMGLWLLQGCRRAWTSRDGAAPAYDDLVREAEAASTGRYLIDPDAPEFLRVDDMPGAISAFLSRTGQGVPQTRGEMVRCVLESLALKYRWVLERLEAAARRRISVVHVVGGGARNALLCQLTADATRRPVTAGPTEATVIGNLGMQLVGARQLGGLADIRTVVRASFPIREFAPDPHDLWEARYAEFVALLARGGQDRGGARA
jgi:rhamnulokinase